MYDIHHFINGVTGTGSSSARPTYLISRGGAVIGKVHLATRDDVNTAVAAAKSAFPGWAAATPLRRSRILGNFATGRQNADRIAALISSEHGKVHDDALVK